jgi:hypothetical protein
MVDRHCGIQCNANAPDSLCSTEPIEMTVRSKLLITIGVLYLAALVGIGVYAVRSANETNGVRASPAVPAEPSKCIGWSLVGTDLNGFEDTGPPVYRTREEASESAAQLNARFPTLPPTKFKCGTRSIAVPGVPARTPIPPKTIYERETITTALMASTLAMAVAVGSVLV